MKHIFFDKFTKNQGKLHLGIIRCYNDTHFEQEMLSVKLLSSKQLSSN